jgi:micrococcal nuclease
LYKKILVIYVAYVITSLQVSADCKWLSQAQLDAALPLPPQLPSNSVEHIYYSDLRYVHDGDSIRLQGGDQVRMRYINSLELARYSYPAQPLAQAARDYVMSHLNELRVYLQFGLQQQDHYGRLLASVYNAHGHWVAPALVSQGLAYVVSIPPAIAPACLWQLERDAKAANTGLWGLPDHIPVAAQSIEPSVTGFTRVQGKVVNVTRAQTAWYIDIADSLVIKIPHKNSKFFKEGFFSNLPRHVVTVRGWLKWRSLTIAQKQRGYRPAIMVLRHPDMFEAIQ